MSYINKITLDGITYNIGNDEKIEYQISVNVASNNVEVIRCSAFSNNGTIGISIAFKAIGAINAGTSISGTILNLPEIYVGSAMTFIGNSVIVGWFNQNSFEFRAVGQNIPENSSFGFSGIGVLY